MTTEYETIDALILRHNDTISELEEIEKNGWINKGSKGAPDSKTIEYVKHYMRIGCATAECIQRIFNVSQNVTTRIKKTFK